MSKKVDNFKEKMRCLPDVQEPCSVDRFCVFIGGTCHAWGAYLSCVCICQIVKCDRSSHNYTSLVLS